MNRIGTRRVRCRLKLVWAGRRGADATGVWKRARVGRVGRGPVKICASSPLCFSVLLRGWGRRPSRWVPRWSRMGKCRRGLEESNRNRDGNHQISVVSRNIQL
jgi:hypothetical protein